VSPVTFVSFIFLPFPIISLLFFPSLCFLSLPVVLPRGRIRHGRRFLKEIVTFPATTGTGKVIPGHRHRAGVTHAFPPNEHHFICVKANNL
jgi:hypothetical protein